MKLTFCVLYLHLSFFLISWTKKDAIESILHIMLRILVTCLLKSIMDNAHWYIIIMFPIIVTCLLIFMFCERNPHLLLWLTHIYFYEVVNVIETCKWSVQIDTLVSQTAMNFCIPRVNYWELCKYIVWPRIFKYSITFSNETTQMYRQSVLSFKQKFVQWMFR